MRLMSGEVPRRVRAPGRARRAERRRRPRGLPPRAARDRVWVVYAEPPFDGPKKVPDYLSRKDDRANFHLKR